MRKSVRAVAAISLLTAALPLSPSDSIARSINWVRQFGTSGTDFGSDALVSRQGSVYVAGDVGGRLPRQRSAGGVDAFVRKYQAQGHEVWTRQFGTEGADHSSAVGGNRNVFVAGSTEGALPGQTSSGGTDAFLRKYEPTGRPLWTRQFGTEAQDAINGVDADARGNVYVAGTTESILSDQTPAGGTDAFLRKYDGDGKELWTRQFGTESRDAAFGLAEDGSGNIYVVGTTFGVFPGQTSQGPPVGDAFVRKYDSQGSELWTKQFSAFGFPSVEDQALGVAVAGDRSAYVVGYTTGAFPGQTNPGGRDGFLRKYDSLGNELWTRQFGTPVFDFAFGVATDSHGAVYVAADVGLRPTEAASDAFVAKYDGRGRRLWNNRFGTELRDSARGIDADRRGHAYVAGSTEGRLRGRPSAGGADVFLAKVGPRTRRQRSQQRR